MSVFSDVAQVGGAARRVSLFLHLKLSLNIADLCCSTSNGGDTFAASPAERSKGMKQNIFKSLVQDISPY